MVDLRALIRVVGAMNAIEVLQGGELMRGFSDAELRRLRNEIPVRWVIETLLELPTKEVEGVYRFLCPVCNEFETGLNPHANLGRCFRCRKNFNPIELVMTERGLNFVQSVKLLHQSEQRCSAPLRGGGERQKEFLKGLLATLPTATAAGRSR